MAQPLPNPDPVAPHLAGLLALVGPANRAELLDRLTRDLATVAQDLRSGDPALQRRAAHVLIALAGTLGAQATLARARQLHDAPHPAGDLLTATLADLTLLQQTVAQVAA